MSCVTTPDKSADYFISQYGNDNPEPSKFFFCYGYGCPLKTTVGLTDEQWEGVRRIFTPRSLDARQERERIIEAIAYLEVTVGEITGTGNDVGGTFPGVLNTNQLDCVDEAVNTSTYMTMMKRNGLIKFHELLEPASRGYFLNGWPHTASVIADTGSGEMYVVDSWFLDNGKPPFIMPLKVWHDGWRPSCSKKLSLCSFIVGVE